MPLESKQRQQHATLNVVPKEIKKSEEKQVENQSTEEQRKEKSVKKVKAPEEHKLKSQDKRMSRTQEKRTDTQLIKKNKKNANTKETVETTTWTQPQETYTPPEYPAKPKMISQIEPTDFTQTLLGLKKIRNGIIQTNDNRYIQILEIFPINFYKLLLKDQISVINSFYSMFRNSPIKGHFISITDKTDSKQFINHIQAMCSARNDKKLVAARDNLIRTIEEMAAYSIEYKFYYIYAYEGNVDGIRSTKFEDIYRSIKIKENAIRDVFYNCGNVLASPENPDMAAAEILYKFFNRGICEKETLASRILRIQSDYANYMQSIGKPVNYSKINPIDYVAPKYIIVDNAECLYMSGLYYTYMALCDDGYPNSVYPDWLNDLRKEDPYIDIHFYTDMQNHESVVKSAQRKRAWNRATVNDYTAREDARERALKKYKKADSLLSYLTDEKLAEDCFDCLTVLVLYDRNIKNLIDRRDGLREKFKNSELKVECSHNDILEWAKMTMPLCDFNNSIFKRNRRNFLTHTLRHTYMYTKYTLADPKGIPLGLTDDCGIFSYDRFNKRYFNNGNQFIGGSSGAGKSYLLKGIGKRERIRGNKVYYIIPTKGYEFKAPVESRGGLYVKLGPGLPWRLNLMELFPEMGFDIGMVDLSDEENIDDKDKTIVETSVLINKVTSLCTWFSILIDAEQNPYFRMNSMEKDRLNAVLMRLYKDYGFTRDNDSIWKDKARKIKKPMPTFSIWKQYMEEDGVLNKYADMLLPWTEGTFSNFDGQTNIDITNSEICFDVEVSEIGEDKLPAVLYIPYDCCSGLIKSDPETYGVLVADEGWQMMVNEQSAKQIFSTSKLIRGYGGGIIFATQEIKEVTDSKYGAALINNTAIKTILGVEEDEFNRLQPVLGLTEADRDILTKQLKNGQHYFMAKNIKIKYTFLSSLEERFLYESVKKAQKDILGEIRMRDINVEQFGLKPWPHEYGIPYIK